MNASDMTSTARNARESLARGLGALQSDPSVPSHLLELAAPIAQAMGALHQIEKSNGQQLIPHADVALNQVRAALAKLQAQPATHSAVGNAMEAVASSLGQVHALHRAAQASNPELGSQPRMQAAPVAPGSQPHMATGAQYAAPGYGPATGPMPQQFPGGQAPYQTPHQTPQGPPVAYGQPPQALQAPQTAGYAPPQPGPQASVVADPFRAPAPPPMASPMTGAMPGQVPPHQPRTGTAIVEPTHGGAMQPPGFGPTQPAPTPTGSQPTVDAGPPGNEPVVNADLGAHSPTNFYKGLSGNDIIDHGGLFVATYMIPKMGMPIRLKVSLPGGYEFEAGAVVKWVREPSEAGADVAPGFGAQFTQISPDARQLVYRYVRNREPIFHDDL
jgi:hypothetical protein